MTVFGTDFWCLHIVMLASCLPTLSNHTVYGLLGAGGAGRCVVDKAANTGAATSTFEPGHLVSFHHMSDVD